MTPWCTEGAGAQKLQARTCEDMRGGGGRVLIAMPGGRPRGGPSACVCAPGAAAGGNAASADTVRCTRSGAGGAAPPLARL